MVNRMLVYPGAIPLETDVLNGGLFGMVGLGNALRATLGTATTCDGLACTPTLVPSLAVTVAPGSIHSLQNVDGTAYGSLGADTTHQVMKQGLLPDAVTLATPAPATAGQSVVYLIQAAYADQDVSPVVLPYYNAANPAVAYSGPANSGVAQNTVRKGVCVVSAKTGVAATTGTQTTPAPDAGYVGLYAVTVANAQSTVTSGNIATLTSAPIIGVKLPDLQVLGTRPLSNTTGGISLVRAYPGNPNGHVAGNAAAGANPPDFCWDTTNALLYVCTGTGTAGSATWGLSSRGRAQLPGNLTLYVRTDGSDSNDGSANTAGSAFLTMQRAADAFAAMDVNGFVPTVKAADGTYPNSVRVLRALVGGEIQFVGNTTTPASCVISTTGADAFGFQGGARGGVGGFKVQTTTSGGGVYASDPGTKLTVTAPMAFGAIAGGTTGPALSAGTFSQVVVAANLTFAGSCGIGINASGGNVTVGGVTITMSGTPNFTSAFAVVGNVGALICQSATFTGSATGKRYNADTNAVINTAGQGASYFPGDVAGTTASGGQYV